MQWYSIDLHLHTPASIDYQQPEVSYLDILKRAEESGLDLIAFTDHNTVSGYRKMMEDIEQLKFLQELNRILPEEKSRLADYNRILKKILLLPGFEFTATFGFHILAIFPQEKPVREIEHILLSLNIPPDQLDDGSVTIGASSDVLTAYRIIDEGGGIAIAAHANSNNGVAMRGFAFGGQTKISFTQDPHLYALEVTDLDHRGKRSTARFFNGTKPEYPRRMHCIQGSDSHRLTNDPKRKKNMGVGGRVTEVRLHSLSFEALKNLFIRNDFARTRPRHRRKGEGEEFDFIRTAREEGSNIIQEFHEGMTVRGGKLYSIIADVCAFSNTNGGTLYIGLSGDVNQPVPGISNPNQAIARLEKEIGNRISPPLQCVVDNYKTGEKNVLRVLVPRGDDPPYAVDDNKIYIRSEAETGLAVRDEIVGLVKDTRRFKEEITVVPDSQVVVETDKQEPVKSEERGMARPPRTGVEIVSVNERNNVFYYTVKDLRNGNVVKNVTPKSASRLWHYAITSYAKLPSDLSRSGVEWSGNLGMLRRYKQRKSTRYDLVQTQPDGGQKFYFGVTEEGINEDWRELVGGDE
jgi:hypothetical protein